MSALTSANFQQAIAKVIATEVQEAVVGELIMGNLIARASTSQGSQVGDTVNIPIGPVMTANNIAEGGSVILQTANLGNASVVLTTHAEASFQLPNAVEAILTVNGASAHMDSAVKAIGEKIETDILTTAILFTANTNVGTQGVALSEATIDAAELALFNAKVPAGQKYLIVTGSDYSTLRQIPRLTETRTAGPDAAVPAIRDGVITMVKSLQLFRSQFVLASSGNRNLAFHRNSMALASADLPTPNVGALAAMTNIGGFSLRAVNSWDKDTLSEQWTIDTMYGVAPVRNSFAIQVLS
jgi:hypothetical protein